MGGDSPVRSCGDRCHTRTIQRHRLRRRNTAGPRRARPHISAVTTINRQIQELAPVINSPTIAEAVTVKSSEEHTPVHAIVKKQDGATYVFAVSMYKRDTKASIQITGLPQKASAEVLGEARTVPVVNGLLPDDFAGYAVHLYRIATLK